MSEVISIEAMHAREILYANLRDFFRVKQVIEVETTVASVLTGPSTAVTSMQALVAAGSGALYQITKAFRDDVIDRRHLKEFSVLHWHLPTSDLEQTLSDLISLFSAIFSGEVEPERRSYRQAFIQRLGFDPMDMQAGELRQQARRLGLNVSLGDDRKAWRDVMFSHFIEPTLGLEMPLFLLDLPISGQTDVSSTQVQKLVDIFIDGIKVGSVSAVNSEQVLESQQISISLGLDRLLMIMLETRQITKTLAVTKGFS